MLENFYKDIEKLTKDLVGIESIVSNGTETKLAKFVYEYYSRLDYFKENPDQLIFQKTINDQVERHNTICLLKGSKGKSNKTLVLLGHLDTVGIDDYKGLKNLAFSPDELEEALKKENLAGKIREDLESGKYMFGRGALDMKSGLANHMVLIKYFSENLDKFDGHIVAVAECDEEGSSTGIVSALEILDKFKKDYNLDYQVAVNSDFTTALYEGDEKKYAYLGTVGKLLTSFYVGGVESHVGQPFAGLDPNLILSAIDRRLNLNTDFCDISHGETTLPPVCLQLRDLKAGYDVQTAISSNSYYNYATHSQSPQEVLDLMKGLAKDAVEEVLSYHKAEKEKWCKKAKYECSEPRWTGEVYSWKEYEDKLIDIYGKEYEDFLTGYKNDLMENQPDLSIPEFSLKLIDRVYKKFGFSNNPTVIFYYGSPFYQNVEISSEEERERQLLASLKRVIENTKGKVNEDIELKYFYPYISDSSFMYLPENTEGIKAFKENFPAWASKYRHPVEEIRKISMPVVNLGVYGHDGHKYTERVHKEYSFQTLPYLIKGFIEDILG